MKLDLPRNKKEEKKKRGKLARLLGRKKGKNWEIH